MQHLSLSYLMNLTESLKQHSQAAFEKIYYQFHEQIYCFIISKTKSAYIAQEVTQLTFIKVWQQRDKLNSDLDIQPQLFNIARQIMIDELRKEATRFKHEGQYAETPFTDSLIDAIESRELLRIMEKDISEMPKMRRLVFELSRKQGLSHKEIAELFSISPKTVEQHIGRALAQLKQHLYTIFL